MNIDIDLKEALRYMGCNGQDNSLTEIANECISEIKEIMTPRLAYEVCKVDITGENTIKIGEDVVINSNDIKKLLEKSQHCVVLVVTLGAVVDRKISMYQHTDMSKAVVFDACASAAVEALCEFAVQQIKTNEIVKFLTIRYSPGYGDFDISCQKDIIRLTNAYKKIGVTTTSSMVLTPKKSVTAVMGITDAPYMTTYNGCDSCNLKDNCQYRKKGKYCERQ